MESDALMSSLFGAKVTSYCPAMSMTVGFQSPSRYMVNLPRGPKLRTCSCAQAQAAVTRRRAKSFFMMEQRGAAHHEQSARERHANLHAFSSVAAAIKPR